MPASILVTGGAGYLGSHVCKALHAAGYKPVSYDDLSNGHMWAAQWGPLVQGDIFDVPLLTKTISAHNIVAVVHTAGHHYPSVAATQPNLAYHINVGGSLAVLRAMREAKVLCLLHSSCAAVYGTAAQMPVTEAQVPAPREPFGASKRMVEVIVGDYAAAFGFKSTSLRHTTVAGADPNNEIGALRKTEDNLVAVAAQAALGNAVQPVVYGGDQDTCTRDFVHVSDVAAAYPLALARLLKGEAVASAYNVGSGKKTTEGEVLQAIAQLAGKTVAPKPMTRRAGDPTVMQADISLAARELNWAPQLSTLACIVETTWAWELKCQQERP